MGGTDVVSVMMAADDRVAEEEKIVAGASLVITSDRHFYQRVKEN